MVTAVVVGSSHAGISAAHALVAQGARVIVVDVGEQLDPGRREIVDRLSHRPPSDWDQTDIAKVTENPTVHDPRPMRLAFGSKFPYALKRPAAPLDRDENGPAPTFARGGFSTIWGGVMLPADDCDLTGWPITRKDLAPYYRDALAKLPFSAVQDRLAEKFPLYGDHGVPLRLPHGGRRLLERLDKSKALRKRDDVVYGQARLAVEASARAERTGCIYCGRCLSGCVYGSIYSAEQDLDRLLRSGAVEYRPGLVVREVTESGDQVRVHCKRIDGGCEDIEADRVFLAAGAINSTRIVMESRRMFDRAISMQTSQGFVLPMLTSWRSRFEWPNSNTLASVLFEFKVPGLSDHWVHSQINPANELVLARLDFDPMRRNWRDRVLRHGFDRLLIALCNFHSEHAGSHDLTLMESDSDSPPTLEIATRSNPEFSRIANHVGRHLLKLLAPVGVLPATPMLWGIGNKKPWGWQFGGSLPMRRSPTADNETDELGRPMGWSRVHVVDSSVFPSLPATTSALTAMANARRIVDQTILTAD